MDGDTYETNIIYIIIRHCSGVGAFRRPFCVPNSVALASLTLQVTGPFISPHSNHSSRNSTFSKTERGGEGREGRGGEGRGQGRAGEGAGQGRGGEGRGGGGDCPHFPQTRTFVTAEPSRPPAKRVTS